MTAARRGAGIPPWMLKLLTTIFRLVARLAPADARHDWGADALDTFIATCERAFAERGWFALVRVACMEWFDLARATAIVRVEARPALRLATDHIGPRARGIRFWRDVRLAARSVRTGGMTTLTAALTLAVGIGTSAAVFSVLDSILWRQVPFRDPARIVEIANFNVAQKLTYTGFRRELLLEWRKQSDVLSAVEAFEHTSFVFAGDRGTQMIPGAVVTPGLFHLLGVAVAEGRAFAPGDGRGGAAQIAIVSDAFWREFLGGANSAIGTDIALDGRRYRVAGVMPSTFRFPSGLEQIWTPYDIDQPPAEATQSRGMTAVARLADGVTRDDADRRVRARGEPLNLASGGRKGTTAALMNTAGGVDDASEKSLQVLTGAVCFLFLIVCANVANITLSRSAARAHDLATCAALGAAPGDLWRQVLLEQAMVASAGVAGGAVLAWAGVSAAAAVLPESMTSATLNAIDLDSRTLLFLMTGGVIAALGSGLAPALVARRTSVVSLLNMGARSSASSLANRFRTALAVAEVAVSVLLLVGSALMTRTFLNRALEDPGFDPVNLVSLRVGYPARYGDAAARDRAAVELSARLQGIGGAKSTVGGLPSDVDLMSFGQFEFEGREGLTEPTPVPVHEVPPDYFEVTGMRLLRGRTFAAADTNPVVVNDRFAKKFFPSSDAVGRRFRVGTGPWRTIVGVAADTSAATSNGERRLETFYPVGSVSDAFRASRTASAVVDFRTFLVRAPQGRAAIPALVGVVQAFDPSLVVWKSAMVEDVLAGALARPRAIFLLMSVFAGTGLLISTAGLYAVLAHIVALRRREFGIRIALGASASQVQRVVIGRGLAIASVGVVLGLIGTMSLAGTMRALLYEMSPIDSVSILVAAVFVGLTALFACWWPARRAGKVDPTELLRAD
jgi:predicted permease